MFRSPLQAGLLSFPALRIGCWHLHGPKEKAWVNVQKPLRIENGKLEVGHFAIRSGWKTAQDAAGLRLRQLIMAVLDQQLFLELELDENEWSLFGFVTRRVRKRARAG
jgi:hypothetical protein